MKARRLGAVAAAATLALTLAACGSGTSGGDAGSGDALKIGIKFDQPGLGLKQGTEYTGMDVDVAKYVAKGARHLGGQHHLGAGAQRPARGPHLHRSGELVVATYSITDARKEKVSFAGPYFVAGQDLLVRADDTSITGPDTLNGKKLCSVTGSTSAQKVKDKFARTVHLQEFGTYSECLAALASGAVDALTTDDAILAGFAAQPENKGKFKLVGKPFSTENYGIGLKKGDTALCQKITDAIKKMQSDGSLQKAIDANLGPANYKPGAGNPPTPAACS